MAWLLVLGAKSDIARATARKFASKGYNVMLAGRDVQQLQRDADDLKIRYSIESTHVPFDALDYGSHQGVYDNLPHRPDIVLCAVGYLGEQGKAQGDFIEARLIIETNYTGCVSMLDLTANDMEHRGSGFIIGISSVAGDRGRQSNYHYGSSKAAFSAYLSGMRARLYKSGVHVMTVKPGFVYTKMTEGLPLPRPLTAMPDDTANDIYTAFESKKDVLYTKWFWRYIMLIIKMIPEGIFKKLKL